jgi:ribosomal protein L16 Arg81 hydroxylase
MIDFGMARGQFHEEYSEKKSYLRRGAVSPDYFSWGDLEQLLYCTDARGPSMVLYNGGVIPEAQYTEDVIEIGLQRRRIRKPAFYRLLRDGATLVLNRTEHRSLGIRRLCVAIGQFVGEHTVGNGYLAYAGDGTFGAHWDTHDVFAVQLLGRKGWRVFEPTFDLPITSQTSREHKHECPEKPYWEGTLEAGDVLYIPRGWWHHAIPMQDQHTFHVAVGVHRPMLLDYLLWACAHRLPLHVDCRRSLPVHGDSFDRVVRAFDAIRSELLDPENLRAFRRRVLERERVDARFDLQVLSPDRVKKLAPAERVTLNSAYALRIDGIAINGSAVQLSPCGEKILEVLMSQPSCSIEMLRACLPDCSEDQIRDEIDELVLSDLAEKDNPDASL